MKFVRAAFLLAASAALASVAGAERGYGARQVILSNIDEDAFQKAFSEIYDNEDAATEEYVYADDEERDIFESAWDYSNDDDDDVQWDIVFEEGDYPGEDYGDVDLDDFDLDNFDFDNFLYAIPPPPHPPPPGPPGKFPWHGGQGPLPPPPPSRRPPPPPSDGPCEPGEPGEGEPERPGRPGRPGRPDRPGRPGRPGRPERPEPVPRHPGHPHCPDKREPHPPEHGPVHRFPGVPPPLRRHLAPILRHLPPSMRPPFFGRRHPKRHSCPHHGHRHHPIHTNLTIYEMLEKSKYTTKLFALVKEDEELSELLKSTTSNITFFAPTDKAFERLPHPPHNTTDDTTIAWDHKEVIKALLKYHTSPEVYDSKKLFVAKTIPSGLAAKALNGEPQRIRIHGGLFGIRINFLAKIIAADIYGTNGVVHGLDNFIFLPPNAISLLDLLPTEFSTTAYAIAKTGLAASIPEGAKTVFAPSNNGWKSLGLKINAFLFSKYGEKHLAALMKYHISVGKVVYSDHVTTPPEGEGTADKPEKFHIDLPTLLGDKKISVDIINRAHWAHWILNGRVPVYIRDMIARDGVIQVPGRVLIPPFPTKDGDQKEQEPFRVLDEDFMTGEPNSEDEDGVMTIEELKLRLEPYM